METIAYLYATALQEAPITESSPAVVRRSSAFSLRSMSCVLALCILGFAHAALALRVGDTGPEVTNLQNRLRERGFFSGPVSGLYGPLTEEAVRRFQASSGLTVDGIAGTNTLAALATGASGGPAILVPTGAMRLGSSGTEVTNLQNRLKALGFYTSATTGYFGPLTEEAVRKFQTSRGLTPDGIVGPNTSRALQGNTSSNAPAATKTTIAAVTATGGSALTPAPANILRVGDSGARVTDLQTKLAAAGYFTAAPTGQFGSITEAAVKRFQSDNQLVVDGLVGPNTLAKLTQVAAKPSTTTARTTQTAARPLTQTVAKTTAEAARAPSLSVSQLQQRLKDRGFYDGPIDGLMSNRTLLAVTDAQQYYQVPRQDILNGLF